MMREQNGQFMLLMYVCIGAGVLAFWLFPIFPHSARLTVTAIGAGMLLLIQFTSYRPFRIPKKPEKDE